MKPTRRKLLRAMVGGSALALAAPLINLGRSSAFGAAAGSYSHRALDIVARSLVIDMLGNLHLNDDVLLPWMSGPGRMKPEDQAAFRNSGLSAVHQAVGVGGPTAYEDALTYMAMCNGFVARTGELFTRIERAADLDAAKSARKIGVIIGLQNADQFRSPEDVATFHGLGMRCAQLTYNEQNLVGSGSTERVDGGVSDFGVEIIRKMNEAGMLVDVSHSGPRTTLDAIELSAKPIAFTHSNCRALNDHPRLKTDEAIRSLAAKGGVMGITGVRMFVRDREPTTLEHIVDHIDHVVKLVGIDHVGIGSDSDLWGYDALPEGQRKALREGYKASYAFRDRIDTDGFDQPRRIYDLVEALLRRGYGDSQIAAILGGNFRRLLAAVWGGSEAESNHHA